MTNVRVTDEHRRARLARRHGLAPPHRFADVVSAATAMTALHATDPATPHLAAHARVRQLTVADIEKALYATRSLVKVMAMRRTLFVVDRDLLPAVVGSAGRRVADAERRRLAKETAGATDHDGDWITAASAEIVTNLTGRELSTRELRDQLPHLGATFTAAAGTRWVTEVPLMSRLLTILAASGLVARGTNGGHWRIARPRWTSMTTWLGHSVRPGVDELMPQARYRRSEGEAAGSAGLGRSDLFHRRCPADVEHATLEITDLQRGQFATTGTGVRGDPHEQQGLFGSMKAADRGRRAVGVGASLVDEVFGMSQQRHDVDDGGVQARRRLGRATHAIERVAVDHPLLMSPAESGRQGAEPS